MPDGEVSAAADGQMTVVEIGARSSLRVAGVVAATSVLDTVQSTRCLVHVVVDPPDDCRDVTPSPTCDVCNSSDDDHAAHDAAKSPSPSRARGRLSPIFSQLAVRGRRREVGRKQKSAQRCQSWSDCGRRVAIESSLSADRSSSRRRRRRATTGGDVDVDEQDERPIQRFATSLTSTDVRDGRFTARLPVDVMPRGDVMIRMRSGRLEVLQSEASEDDGQPVQRLYGVVELPMYADTDSVTVRHDPLQQSLVIDATIKGYRRAGLRRRSASVDELWPPRGRRVAHNLGVRLMPIWKRREQDKIVILCSETRAVDDHS